MLGFLTELSLQFFSIKSLQLSEAEVALRPITRATEETEDKGLDYFADSKDEHVLSRILWKCLLGRTGIKEK